jgi:3-oxoacyl-ACP reductase-like protein
VTSREMNRAPRVKRTGFQQTSAQAASLLSLRGKVAVVTGAASGIGRGIAVRLAEMGAKVLVVDMNVKGGTQTARAIVNAVASRLSSPAMLHRKPVANGPSSRQSTSTDESTSSAITPASLFGRESSQRKSRSGTRFST